MNPPRAFRRFRRRFKSNRIILALAVLGPGVITAFGGNDASGIIGYSSAGAQYRYNLLWSLILVMFSLGVCQEIVRPHGRGHGHGTRRSHSRRVRGVKITLFAMCALLVANFATTISEFAGIAFGLEAFLPPDKRWMIRYIALPGVALAVWLLVTRSSYERVEKVLLSASLVYIAYLFSAFLARPNWGEVASATVHPDLSQLWKDRGYLFMLINVIGTTITPWGQFYIQGFRTGSRHSRRELLSHRSAVRRVHSHSGRLLHCGLLRIDALFIRAFRRASTTRGILPKRLRRLPESGRRFCLW